MEDLVQKRSREWSEPPFDSATVEEIRSIIKKGDQNELKERFHSMLEFGTGGLRGVIGAGTSRMNIYTVGMATQGLMNYILKTGSAKEGLVIARDSRRMSEEFARETASIMRGQRHHGIVFPGHHAHPLRFLRHQGAWGAFRAW